MRGAMVVAALVAGGCVSHAEDMRAWPVEESRTVPGAVDALALALIERGPLGDDSLRVRRNDRFAPGQLCELELYQRPFAIQDTSGFLTRGTAELHAVEAGVRVDLRFRRTVWGNPAIDVPGFWRSVEACAGAR